MVEDDSGKPPFSIADLPSAPLGDQVQQLSPFDLAAFTRRRAARGSDVVDRLDNAPVDPPVRVGSVALGLAPGAGFADVLGLLPDLEKGGYHPGIVANLLNGDVGSVGWQALGALGDAMYLGGPCLALPSVPR